MNKILIDFLPILAFFLTYKLWGIYYATGVAIVASFMQAIYFKLKKKTLPKTVIVNLAIIALLGGATIFFHNEWFIKWKPSVVYFVFSLALVASRIYFKTNLFKNLTESSLTLSDDIWNKLSDSWAIFFFVAGVLNLVVAYNFGTEFWVNFKLFGLIGLTLLFALLQGIYIARNIEK